MLERCRLRCSRCQCSRSDLARDAKEGGFPSVRPSHPRLFIRSEDLGRLRPRVAASPEEWERMQELARRPPGDPGYGDGRAIRTAALVYLITGEEQYLRSATALAENIARNHTRNRYTTPEALFGLALAYDWCYAGLGPELREEIADAMLCQAEYLDHEVFRHSDFNNHFVLEKVWPFVFAGLALHGDCSDPRRERVPPPRRRVPLRAPASYGEPHGGRNGRAVRGIWLR